MARSIHLENERRTTRQHRVAHHHLLGGNLRHSHYTHLPGGVIEFTLRPARAFIPIGTCHFKNGIRDRLKEGYIVDLGPLGTLYPSVTGPWKQDADDLSLTDMTPKATYQPSDEIQQAIKGATLSWATEKDEKEGTETPDTNGDGTTTTDPDNQGGGDDNGGEFEG